MITMLMYGKKTETDHNTSILSGGRELRLPLSLPFQQSNILINRRPAQITDSCQLADIQLPIAESRIMAEEYCWNIVPGGLRSADLLPLGSGMAILIFKKRS